MKNTIEALKKFYDNGNTRNFRKCMYMHRAHLETISPRYIDALEMILGCEDLVTRNTLMNTLLDFTMKYAEGNVDKSLASGMVLFAMQAIEDLAA